MERKGFMIGAGLAIVGALGLGIWLANDDDDRRSTRLDDEDEEVETVRSHGFDSRPMPRLRDEDEARPAMPAMPRVAPPIPGLVQPMRPQPGAPVAEEEGRPAGVPLPDPDADRSAGWRLGRARARIELVEDRIGSIRSRQAEHVANGNQALAAEQDAVIQRFERRLTQLREEETNLTREATGDGTLRDQQEGFAATHLPERPPAPGR